MSFRYISFLCYNTFRYIKFLFLLYWADDFLLYQFPFYCYIRIRYITFRYINFLFLVISDSVTSNSVISISVFWLYQFPLYQSPLYQFPFFVTSDSVISVSWKNVTSHSVISNSVIYQLPHPPWTLDKVVFWSVEPLFNWLFGQLTACWSGYLGNEIMMNWNIGQFFLFSLSCSNEQW